MTQGRREHEYALHELLYRYARCSYSSRLVISRLFYSTVCRTECAFYGHARERFSLSPSDFRALCFSRVYFTITLGFILYTRHANFSDHGTAAILDQIFMYEFSKLSGAGDFQGL